MTDEQYKTILAKIEEVKDEATDKGHFLILLLLWFIFMAVTSK